ncbi:MAG: hypothetical protein ACYCT0_08145 [Sulfobacillus sp.]
MQVNSKTPRALREMFAWGNAIMKHGKQKIGNEGGQAMVEYALVVAAIAIIAISGLSFLGNTVNLQINHISQGIIKGY